MSFQNKKNIYTCEVCHDHVVTVDIDEGVTPFMIDCKCTPGCKGMMKSSMYRVFDQSMKAGWEWYRPTDVSGLSRWSLDHVSKGGLILRQVPPPQPNLVGEVWRDGLGRVTPKPAHADAVLEDMGFTPAPASHLVGEVWRDGLGRVTPKPAHADAVLEDMGFTPAPASHSKASEIIAAIRHQLEINVQIAEQNSPEGPIVDGKRVKGLTHSQDILAQHIRDHLSELELVIATPAPQEHVRGCDDGVIASKERLEVCRAWAELAAENDRLREKIEGWKPQRWMGPEQLSRQRDDTHEEAMTTILSAAGVCTLSYEEVAVGYARARGFIRDDAEMMCDPVKEASNG